MPDETVTDRSRTERVLSPAFLAGLEQADTDELRRRRDEALAEREYQSYLRRLIQVRQDLLAAELDRRASGGETRSVVERLTKVLAEGPQGRGRGEAVRVTLPDDDMARAETEAGSMLGGASLADPGSLSEQDLDQGLASLDRGQQAVSADRLAVFRVCDTLQEVLKQRYRDDPSQVLRGG